MITLDEYSVETIEKIEEEEKRKKKVFKVLVYTPTGEKTIKTTSDYDEALEAELTATESQGMAISASVVQIKYQVKQKGRVKNLAIEDNYPQAQRKLSEFNKLFNGKMFIEPISVLPEV